MNPTFPLEIFEEIIDLASETPALMATSALVCRSWLSKSRQHLFKTVTLYPIDLDEASLWRQVLQSSDVTVVDHIQEIVIDTDDDDVASVSEIFSCLEHLEKATTIKIDGNLDFSVDISAHRLPTSITKLEMRNLFYDDHLGLFAFLACFSALEELKIHADSQDNDDDVPSSPYRHHMPSTLRSLDISFNERQYTTYFLSWVLASPTPLHVSYLTLHSLFPQHITLAVDLILRTSETLESFTFGFHDHRPEHWDMVIKGDTPELMFRDVDPLTFSLSCCLKLHSIQLFNDVGLQWLILLAGSSQSLQILKLPCPGRWETKDTCHLPTWRKLDSLLAGLPQLQEIEITTRLVGDPGMVLFLQRNLGQCRRRGILSLVDYGPEKHRF
ncbi:hypothetical protein C8J56DRAFT_977869 [Mycena floridula]|nr:hypothetical protein C8J56DRAFT_977869 [Mycena floridula]